MGAFKTKARAIELLGKKQIRDSSTALAELMKNSYDADAEILRVEFLTKNIAVPCVVICDNGCGMDRNDIEDKWLVLGTDSKRKTDNKKSPGGRTLMGEKGIGRLAVSRLGQQLWMFTKKENSPWNILYINWNVFENPDLYIQDVEVPVLYGIDEGEFANAINKLAHIQRKNIDTELWKSDKYVELREKIKKQMRSVKLDLELVYDFCDIISKTKNHGTVLFVFNLEDDWERYLDFKRDVEEDTIASKNRIRLNSFLSNFARTEKNFKTEIYLNDESLELSANFDDADYEIYDLKIEGMVEKGKFKGKLSARNADKYVLDECNRNLQEGITVTAGISNWEESDCGKYTIKLCHFEIKKENSGLTDTELDQIRARMDVAGGISVFRDNVRVLPYGEPENDFLELETRRSKGAGYYLFSHRNMFGRIDITTEDNPGLEDKSSREGLLENQYFYYFIKTLQNLLVQIATDYVGDDKTSSFKLRKSYLDHNNRELEKKKQAMQYEKEQQEQFEEEQKKVQLQLKDGYAKLSSLKKCITNELQILGECSAPNGKRTYQELNELFGMINSKYYDLMNMIEVARKALFIVISEKFEYRYDPELLREIDLFNEQFSEILVSLQELCDSQCVIFKGHVQAKIQEWISQFKKGANIGYDSAKDNLQKAISRLKELAEDFENEYFVECNIDQSKLSEKVNELEKYIGAFSDYETKVKKMGGDVIAEIADKLETLTKRVQRLDYGNADFAITEIKEINRELENCEDNIYSLSDKIRQERKREYDKVNEKLSILLERMNLGDKDIIEQLTIQNYQLKEQVDIYVDLANLGLSAEIVNHEFNQLFANVYNAINHIKLQSLSNNTKYYLRQVEVGFRAISDRQNQLSPMYRSRNMRKQQINIHKMIDDIKVFFDTKLDNQNIKLINDVGADIVLYLSLSKIYPILSNLIYNSLYWVADQKVKIILFHFVKKENALYVEDSGSGISVRNKERVFEPFFSLKKNGRGLGLAIARSVLVAQGHNIEVVLESGNKKLNGACFKITFNTED